MIDMILRLVIGLWNFCSPSLIIEPPSAGTDRVAQRTKVGSFHAAMARERRDEEGAYAS